MEQRDGEVHALFQATGEGSDAARAITQEAVLGPLFAAAVATAEGKAAAKQVASLLANDVLGELRAKKLDAVPFSGAAIVELAALVSDGTISNAQTKEVLAVMFSPVGDRPGQASEGMSPRAIVTEKGLAQIASADALLPVVEEVLAANADTVGRYKAGNANVFGALVGMVMKKSGGRANAKLVKELLEQKLA